MDPVQNIGEVPTERSGYFLPIIRKEEHKNTLYLLSFINSPNFSTNRVSSVDTLVSNHNNNYNYNNNNNNNFSCIGNIVERKNKG